MTDRLATHATGFVTHRKLRILGIVADGHQHVLKRILSVGASGRGRLLRNMILLFVFLVLVVRLGMPLVR